MKNRVTPQMHNELMDRINRTNAYAHYVRQRLVQARSRREEAQRFSISANASEADKNLATILQMTMRRMKAFESRALIKPGVSRIVFWG